MIRNEAKPQSLTFTWHHQGRVLLMTSVFQAVKKYAVAGIILLLALPVQADVLFSPTFISPVGNSPRSVIQGDYNGDGILDVALANMSSGTLSVLPGNGDGSYRAAVNYATGASPYAVAQGDFNRDGKMDLVVTNYLDGSISLFMGFGDGRFSSRLDFYASAYPRGVIAGDFNGDGKLDIAVTNYFDGKFSVLLGTGTGSFSAPVSFAAGVGPQAIASGDVNHDGKTDLVIVNDADNTVSIHRGNGNGTFQPATAYGVGANPQSVELGDLNGDGRTDIVVAMADDNTVAALLGNGDGSFQTPQYFSVGSRPLSVKIANINGDGRPDLVVANGWSNNVSVLLGNGGTLFDPAVHYASGVFPNAIAAGDANRDGKDDVAVTCGSDAILISMVNMTAVEPSGSFNGSAYYEAGTFPVSIVTADFNHDGKLDLAAVNRSSNNVSVYFNIGHGSFAPAVNYTVGANSWMITAADYNSDGNIDLAVTSPGTGSVAVLLSNSDGTFAPASYIATSGTPYGIASIDVNNDGRMDLVMADNANNAVGVLRGNGNGTFQAPSWSAVGSQPFAIAAADFNRDGNVDLAVTNIGNGGNISILYGNGDGSFMPGVNLDCGPDPYSIVTGDFNLDGIIDLATANSGDGTISVLLSTSMGSFQSNFVYGAGSGANFLATGDFNNDGNPDLIAANTQSYYNLYLFMGNGNGIFQDPSLYESLPNAYARSIAVGDFDNNGRLDLAVTNAYANGISILLNTDALPEQFHFVDVMDAQPGTIVLSNSVTVLGTNTAAPISIAGGEYSVSNDGGSTWTAFSTISPTTVGPDGQVRVRQTASASYFTSTDAVLTIGGVSDTFSVTTAADTTPDPFAFGDLVSVPTGSEVMSNAITVMGITATAPISITGGEYEINSSSVWMSVNGFVNNGDIVRVRQNSSSNYATTTSAVLTIGGVSGAFNVTTVAAGEGSTNTEDFETGNLTKWPWVTSGNGQWTVASSTVHGGAYAAEAPTSITHNQFATLDVSRTCVAGSINFWLSVSSETNYDYLIFLIDGIEQGRWSGSVSWRQANFPVTAGTHTFRWVYSKDGSVDAGMDTAWVDDIQFPVADSSSSAFFDDMENGTNKWESMTGLWHLVSSSSPYPNSHSPSHSWWYGEDSTGNYNTGSTNSGQIVTTPFNVPADPVLTFWSWEQTESDGANWDTRRVYISTDNGSTWNQIYQSTDNSSAWRQVSVSIAAYAGLSAKIKFEFNTGDGVANDYRGWYVDDVQVAGSVSPPSECAVQISDTSGSSDSSINDLGEIVWSKFSQETGTRQIYSSNRGQLTNSIADHDLLSINNRGDVVWMENEYIKGLLGGIETQLGMNALSYSHPSINDRGEVVWVQDDPATGKRRIYSNLRGYLPVETDLPWWPSINNAGDVVWSDTDPQTGQSQIFGLLNGVKIQITTDANWHYYPSISNSGEVVWSQTDPSGDNGRIYKRSADGLVTQITYACPYGSGHVKPAINNCGDVIFASSGSGGYALYRFGNNTPCGTEPEPNNTRETAIATASDTTKTGVLDPATDMEDWYSFTANAGDTIKVTVNWDATPPNTVDLSLLDKDGVFITGNPASNSPKEINTTASYTGSYYARLMTMGGSRFGYAVTVKVGIGGGACADPVSPSANSQGASWVNDLGEVVWSQADPGTGYSQIYSSTRGQLTTDLAPHESPSLNNRGDVVWEQKYPWEWTGPIYGIISGQLVQVVADGTLPSINDHQEIVWSRQNNGYWQPYSNRRGFLTNDSIDHLDAAINNKGDLVWAQFDWMTGWNQIYRLAFGETQTVQVTNTPTWHSGPSISNSGEIVWSEGSMPGPGSGARVYSSTRGILTSAACPAGDDHYGPAVNSCGDVVFTSMTNNIGTVYRLGNASPCVSDTEPNNYLPEATLVSGNSTTMGMVQDPGDMEDWYKFTANAGDPITITVNWAPTVSPNMIMVDLMDQNGGWLAGASEPGSPKTITYIAAYSGTYHVHLMAMPGSRVGYTLTLKVGIGGGTCADLVAPSPDGQFSSAINDLGEVAWQGNDPVTGWSQIFSSTRGQLTTDPVHHEWPSINNRGDVVWNQYNIVYGLLSGQLTRISFGNFAYGRPSINDSQEVVWSEMNPETGSVQIYSTRRGWLPTVGSNTPSDPSINNAGDVVWEQGNQVYKYSGGAVTYVPVPIDAGWMVKWAMISNSGEIAWSQGTDWSNLRIYKMTVDNQISQLNSECLAGEGLIVPSLNSCGDVTFTTWSVNQQPDLYRLGNASPCLSDTEPNNFLPEATLVSGNTTTMGMVQDPGDWEDWYKFTANAGDPITVTVNWAPTVSPNMLMVDLMDQYGGWLAGAPEPGSPKTITYTAMYSGTYHVHLMAMPGSRVGYTLTLKVGIGGGACAELVSPSMNMQDYGSGVNDLGEVVWSESIHDGMSWFSQILSSTRGQLTNDPTDHLNPSVNNRGDVVWEQFSYDGSQWFTNIWGLISGQLRQLTFLGGNNFANGPSINDHQEVVWSQQNGPNWQIYSNQRGWLTNDPVDHYEPGINNAGDVVWRQLGPGDYQIYKLAAGSGAAVQLTNSARSHYYPSISNSGEVVWAEDSGNGTVRIYSSTRGQVTFDGCPGGMYHGLPSVNACGDVTFNANGNTTQVYRLGSASPCVSDAEPNNMLSEATLMSNNTTTMGMVQDTGDWEDWYKFTANEGDQIKVTVNWAPTIFPNMLLVDLMDQYGGWVAGSPETGSPKTITYTAMYTGTHHVHLQAMAGRIGYSLALNVIDNMPPTLTIDPVETPTRVNSQTISGLVESGATVTVSINTAAVAGLVTFPTASIWSCTITGLAEGSNIITVSATDAAGNVSSREATITLDTIPPAVSIDPVVSPTMLLFQNISGARESDATITLTVNTVAAVGVVTYPTSTTWNCIVSGLIEGPNDITVIAADSVGNSSIAATSIIVDTVAPVVTISSPAAGLSNVNAPLLSYVADPGIVEVKVDGVSVAQRSGQNLNALAEGTHTIRVESTDAAGNTGFGEVTLIIDTLPPTATVDPVTTPTKVNVQTIGGGRESGALITVTVDTSASIGPVVYPTDATWSSTVTGLAEGTNNITITAKDGAQNSAAVTASITYDSIAPTVSISSPVSGATKDNTPRLDFAISGETLSMVSVDGVTVSKTSGQDLDALADGPHTVRVEAIDAAGNTGFAQVTFTVDTIPPSVGINPVSTPTNVSSQTLTGTREENAVVSVAVNTSASAGAIAYPSPTTWSCTISNLATGSNAVTVTATDAAGNPAIAEATIAFDGIAPTVSITSPGSAPTNDNTPLLTYSASDGSVVVKVDGAVVSRVSGDSLDTLSDGSHAVRVESTDVAGNTGFAQVTFIVDTAEPAISIDPVTTPTKIASQTITGTRESGASVSVTVDTSATVGPVSYASGTTWSCTISNLVRGSNVITVRAVDAAGNNASATATIKKT